MKKQTKICITIALMAIIIAAAIAVMMNGNKKSSFKRLAKLVPTSANIVFYIDGKAINKSNFSKKIMAMQMFKELLKTPHFNNDNAAIAWGNIGNQDVPVFAAIASMEESISLEEIKKTLTASNISSQSIAETMFGEHKALIFEFIDIPISLALLDKNTVIYGSPETIKAYMVMPETQKGISPEIATQLKQYQNNNIFGTLAVPQNEDESIQYIDFTSNFTDTMSAQVNITAINEDVATAMTKQANDMLPLIGMGVMQQNQELMPILQSVKITSVKNIITVSCSIDTETVTKLITSQMQNMEITPTAAQPVAEIVTAIPAVK